MSLPIDTALTYCTYCPKLCRHACPVSNAEPRESLVPQAKMAQMRRLRRGEVPPLADETEPLWACTNCGACTEACAHGVEVGQALFTGRDEAARQGRAHVAVGSDGSALAARMNARAEEATAAIRSGVPVARRPSQSQVAFFAGCRAPELAPKMLALCDRLGADYVAVADVDLACGGYPLYAGGQHDAFRMHAERTAHELRGYARVVVHCPSCAWLMKNEYAKFGVQLRSRVEHTVEMLESFAERLPVATKTGRVAWHDPCHLGRMQGLYDAPRRLTARAVDEVVELDRKRADARCSGGGGLVPITMPETARAMADTVRQSVREAGVDTVVTACASCRHQLDGDGIRARDLIDLLEEATRPPEV